MRRYIVGIDEVGRGPLAGPVAVGIVICRKHFSIDGITDSKLMTEEARERVSERAKELQEEGLIRFGVFSTSASDIDSLGIEKAIGDAVSRGLAELTPNPENIEIVLDGRLKAPPQYRQQSIIHGDFLVPAISLASIVAKVERDAYMTGTIHEKYPAYGFSSHKGYGTGLHIAAIKEHGPSPIHRMSFLTGVLGDRIVA
jgi:ribonuclease HII